jgi:hypothetical protein
MNFSKEEFRAAFLGLAKKHDFDLETFWMSLYMDVFKDLGFDKCYLAIRYFCETTKPGKHNFPTIKDFKDKILGGQPTTRMSSDDRAGRVLDAIRKYGYTSPEAKEYMCDVGWWAIGGSQGYIDTCKNLEEREIPIWRAQLRDRIEAGINKKERGISLDAIEEIKVKTIDAPKNILDFAKSLCERTDGLGICIEIGRT